MDTSAEVVTTDSLGRRTGPRQKHTIEEKRRIVEETHVRGASVASVARRHQVNANQVFAWRQLYRKGLLKERTSEGIAELLPVKVTTPTVMPAERSSERTVSRSPPRPRSSGMIEIELPDGRCIRLHGRVDRKALAHVMKVLVLR